MIDRYQLRYFLAVVETGGFSRAAAQVNVTQPTLSAGIAKLEQALGARLFLRNSRRVQLTEEGSRFLKHARAIENEFAQAEKKVGHGQARPLIRLGVLNTIPAPLLASVIERHVAAERPDRLELVEGGERDLLTRLDRARIDVALTLVHASPTRFAQEVLYSEGYSLAVCASHRYADADEVEGADLANDVMIVRRHCELLPVTSRFFTERAVRPEFSYRSTHDERVLALVRAGLGLTVMPDSYQAEGVKRPRLAGFDHRRQIGLIYREDPAILQEQSRSIIPALRNLARPD